MNLQETNNSSKNQERTRQILIEVDPDTLIEYRMYHEKLTVVRKKLDSLDNIHEEINSKLKELKNRSELIRKGQQHADLFSGFIIIIITIVIIRFVHAKLKSKKK